MYLKISKKLEIEETFLMLINIVYEKSTTSITPNGEKLNTLIQRSGTSKDIIPNHCLELQ